MDVDWRTLFVPQASLLELFIRGSGMYLVVFALLRILVRRHVGSLGIADLLVLVLIADAAQNGMAAEYRSISEGIVLCATIIGWSCLLDWLAFRFRFIRKLLEPPPLVVLRDGVLEKKSLKRELITREEMESLLRHHGVMDPRTVRIAFIEPDGQLSVFQDDASRGETTKPDRFPGV